MIDANLVLNVSDTPVPQFFQVAIARDCKKLSRTSYVKEKCRAMEVAVR